MISKREKIGFNLLFLIARWAGSKAGIPGVKSTKFCWMAVHSLGCMSEKNSGYLGSAIVLDMNQLDLSLSTHAETMAETIVVLQMATGGSFTNRSKSVSQILFPYILTT